MTPIFSISLFALLLIVQGASGRNVETLRFFDKAFLTMCLKRCWSPLRRALGLEASRPLALSRKAGGPRNSSIHRAAES